MSLINGLRLVSCGNVADLFLKNRLKGSSYFLGPALTAILDALFFRMQGFFVVRDEPLMVF